MILLLLFLLAFGLIAPFLLSFVCPREPKKARPEHHARPTKLIIFFLSEHCSSAERIIKEFMLQLGLCRRMNFEFKMYQAGSDEVLADQIQHLVTLHPDLIFSYGMQHIKQIETALDARNLCVPILFYDKSDQSPREKIRFNRCVRGIHEPLPNFDTIFSHIKTLMPQIQRAILIYSQSSNNCSRTSVEKALSNLDIRIVAVPQTEDANFSSNLSPIIDEHSFIITLCDIYADQQFEQLCTLSVKKKIPLFSTNSCMLQEGATLACGTDMQVITSKLIDMAYALLLNGYENIPQICDISTGDQLLISEHMLEKIESKIDPKLAVLLKYVDVNSESII